MKIKRVTIEYDEATYIAEGEDAQSWRNWMLDMEERARKAHLLVWDAWTRIDSKEPVSAIPDGPTDPV